MQNDSPAALTPIPTEGCVRHQALQLQAGACLPIEACVADEVPVALVYNGISHAVMMATPLDLVDFALGFSLSEGILASPDELLDVEIEPSTAGITLQLSITARREVRLKERRRVLAGRTGCGLCGTDSLQEALRPVAAVGGALRVTASAIDRAMTALPQHQPLNLCTGATHAAAWCDTQGDVRLVREDVGRHNALDKLIGAQAAMQLGAGWCDGAPAPIRDDGFVIVTSRASFEMVHKCASAGVQLLAAISAPTALAASLAAQADMTLVGYARGGRATVYAGGERLGLQASRGEPVTRL